MNNQPQMDTFEAELQEMQSTLLEATSDLTSPLGDLVRAQIQRSRPPLCGATVLTVAKPAMNVENAPEEADLHHKRVLLAAALEMLHVALNVHRLLVNAARREQQRGNDATLDRSFIGSTILAGDYCFSRAAQMAAQTDHPRVVAAFSLALQTVSEGLLREQFHGSNDPNIIRQDGDVHPQQHSKDSDHSPLNNTKEDIEEDIERYRNGHFDVMRQLLHSGAQAAALLAGLSESEQQQAVMLSHELASHWVHNEQEGPDAKWQQIGYAPKALPTNWQVLYDWFNHQRTNGEIAAYSS